jgi:hypothetical protein
MANKYTKTFVENLNHQIEELELTLQLHCDEKQEIISAGEDLKDFIEELITAGLLHDETFDKANQS